MLFQNNLLSLYEISCIPFGVDTSLEISGATVFIRPPADQSYIKCVFIPGYFVNLSVVTADAGKEPLVPHDPTALLRQKIIPFQLSVHSNVSEKIILHRFCQVIRITKIYVLRFILL